VKKGTLYLGLPEDRGPDGVKGKLAAKGNNYRPATPTYSPQRRSGETYCEGSGEVSERSDTALQWFGVNETSNWLLGERFEREGKKKPGA